MRSLWRGYLVGTDIRAEINKRNQLLVVQKGTTIIALCALSLKITLPINAKGGNMYGSKFDHDKEYASVETASGSYFQETIFLSWLLCLVAKRSISGLKKCL